MNDIVTRGPTNRPVRVTEKYANKRDITADIESLSVFIKNIAMKDNQNANRYITDRKKKLSEKLWPKLRTIVLLLQEMKDTEVTENDKFKIAEQKENILKSMENVCSISTFEDLVNLNLYTKNINKSLQEVLNIAISNNGYTTVDAGFVDTFDQSPTTDVRPQPSMPKNTQPKMLGEVVQSSPIRLANTIPDLYLKDILSTKDMIEDSNVRLLINRVCFYISNRDSINSRLLPSSIMGPSQNRDESRAEAIALVKNIGIEKIRFIFNRSKSKYNENTGGISYPDTPLSRGNRNPDNNHIIFYTLCKVFDEAIKLLENSEQPLPQIQRKITGLSSGAGVDNTYFGDLPPNSTPNPSEKSHPNKIKSWFASMREITLTRASLLKQKSKKVFNNKNVRRGFIGLVASLALVSGVSLLNKNKQVNSTPEALGVALKVAEESKVAEARLLKAEEYRKDLLTRIDGELKKFPDTKISLPPLPILDTDYQISFENKKELSVPAGSNVWRVVESDLKKQVSNLGSLNSLNSLNKLNKKSQDTIIANVIKAISAQHPNMNLSMIKAGQPFNMPNIILKNK